jgi:hypothetical protein
MEFKSSLYTRIRDKRKERRFEVGMSRSSSCPTRLLRRVLQNAYESFAPTVA